MSKKRVAVFYGGTSEERKVSLMSVQGVLSNLDSRKYAVEQIEVTPNPNWIEKHLSKIKKCDVALLVLHGLGGEDGTVQGLLDLLGIPYTCSDVLTSALCMNKDMSNKQVAALGMKLPKSVLIMKGKPYNLKGLGNQVVVKPNRLGSSIGISIITRNSIKQALSTAFRFGEEVLVQDFIPGREITVSILGRKNPRVLPPAEILPLRKSKFWDYEAKYEDGGADHLIPAPLSEKQVKQVQEMALKIHMMFGCKGMTRTDFILTKSGEFYFLEINTIPGMTKYSLVPQSAAAVGIAYPKLLDFLIKDALENR